jgi:MFS transporter, DHA3 family, macrolide efflux protein
LKSNRNFLYLILGHSLANIGDVLYVVAIIRIIYSITESAAVASFVPFTITTAMFLSSIATPLLVGRFRLKLLLVSSQIGKTFLLTGLAIFILSGIDITNYQIIFVIIIGIALLDGCANPIRQTLIPYYVKSDELIKANGIAETVTQSIQIGTWFLGSLLLMALSATKLIWLVCCLFAISSLILGLLENVQHGLITREKKWAQLTEGWKTIRLNPFLKLQATIEFLETIASTVWIAAIVYVFVEQALHEQEQWWGYINSTYFIGLVLGSIICVKFSSFVEKRQYALILLGACMSCLITILFSLTSIPMMALVFSALIGLFYQLKNIPQQTIIQTSVPKEKLATVYTSLSTIGTGTFGISSLMMGFIAELYGVRSVFIFSGLLLGIVSLMVYRNKHCFRNIAMQNE